MASFLYADSGLYYLMNKKTEYDKYINSSRTFYSDTRNTISKHLENSKAKLEMSLTESKSTFNIEAPIIKTLAEIIAYSTSQSLYDEQLNKYKYIEVYLNNMSFANKYNRMLSLINYINTESEIEQIKDKKREIKTKNQEKIFEFIYIFDTKPTKYIFNENCNLDLVDLDPMTARKKALKNNQELRSRSSNEATQLQSIGNLLDIKLSYNNKKDEGFVKSASIDINFLSLLAIDEKYSTRVKEYNHLKLKIMHELHYLLKQYKMKKKKFTNKDFDFDKLIQSFKNKEISEKKFITEYLTLAELEEAYLKDKAELMKMQAKIMLTTGSIDTFIASTKKIS